MLLLSLIVRISVRWKFTHFHGQKISRLDRYKSIYKDSGHKRTKPFKLLSIILFFTPDVHLRELRKVWADKVVIEEVWKNFMQKLISEWMEFVLYVSWVSFFLETQKEHHFYFTKSTVNCYARWKCRVSCYSRRHCRPTASRKGVDHTLSRSDCKLYVIGV